MYNLKKSSPLGFIIDSTSFDQPDTMGFSHWLTHLISTDKTLNKIYHFMYSVHSEFLKSHHNFQVAYYKKVHTDFIPLTSFYVSFTLFSLSKDMLICIFLGICMFRSTLYRYVSMVRVRFMQIHKQWSDDAATANFVSELNDEGQ